MPQRRRGAISLQEPIHEGDTVRDDRLAPASADEVRRAIDFYEAEAR